MNEKGIGFSPFPDLGDFSGGSVYGKTFDEQGIITLTRFGEFVHEITEQGELIVGFPNGGLCCIYDNDGFLESVSIDVGNYFAGFTDKDLKTMPRQGEDLRRLVQDLDAKQTAVILEVEVKDGSMEIITTSPGVESIRKVKTEDFNFYQNSDGIISFGEISFALFIERRGDEFVIGMGELGRTPEENRAVSLLVISDKVDFIDDILAKSPQSLQKLASRILLN